VAKVYTSEGCADAMVADGEAADRAAPTNDHESRLAALERWAHEPFDFSDLIRRIEALERAAGLGSK
jgi:hypothetical protein